MSETPNTNSTETPAPEADATGTLLTDPAPADENAPAGEAPAGTLLTDPAPAGEDTPAGEAEGPAEGAPEEYADFEAPEGIEFDVETAGELKTLAREFNLSQGQAQKIADLGARLIDKWLVAYAEHVDASMPERFTAERARLATEWAETSTTEIEPGARATARRAVDTYGSPGFVAFLNEGYGNHPEIIKFLAKVGATVSEDGFVAGGGAPVAEKSLADRLYPTTAKQGA